MFKWAVDRQFIFSDTGSNPILEIEFKFEKKKILDHQIFMKSLKVQCLFIDTIQCQDYRGTFEENT